MEKRDFRILVVDDDEIVRDVVRSLLAREGYSVITAKGGRDAVEILDREQFMMVITDLSMPEIGGMEVLKHAIKRDQDLCVVILTAYGTLDTTLEAMREGAYDYVTKPFKGQEILMIAGRAFERTGLIRENRELKANLKELFLSAEVLDAIRPFGKSDGAKDWAAFAERLTETAIFTVDEMRFIRERLSVGNAPRISIHN
jgi:two-component system response regulator PilR (NtrC family)